MTDVEGLLQSKGFQAYVPDEDSCLLSNAEGRVFLHNCISPAVGQRVEVVFAVQTLPGTTWKLRLP